MTYTDDMLAALKADWPRWQIWAVYRVYGGTVWCARPWDDEKRVLNAASPDELTEYLEEEASR